MNPFIDIKTSTSKNLKRSVLNHGNSTHCSASEKKPKRSPPEQRKENHPNVIDLTLLDEPTSYASSLLEKHFSTVTNSPVPPGDDDTLLCYDRFPPTIYTNVQYKKGIRLKKAPSDDDLSEGWINCVVPEEYYANRFQDAPSRPALSDLESVCWTQPHTAHCIATTARTSFDHRFPNHTARFLGTITRFLPLPDMESAEALEKLGPQQDAASAASSYHGNHGKGKAFQKKLEQAVYPSITTVQKIQQVEQRRHAKRVAAGVVCEADNLHDAMATEPDRFTVERVRQDWKDAVTSTPVTKFNAWHERRGHLLYSSIGEDRDFISVKDLLFFLEDELEYLPVKDKDANDEPTPTPKPSMDVSVKEDDGSYTSGEDSTVDPAEIMEELIDILHACNDLSHPTQAFWNIPLLIVYPVVQWYSIDGASNLRIQIALYAHRLLMETFTTHSVSVLLRAMDPSSYRVTVPRVRPLIPPLQSPVDEVQDNDEESIFECSQYPIVSMEAPVKPPPPKFVPNFFADLSSSDEEEEDVKPQAKEEPTVSAFTTLGLLKLLEQEGLGTDQYIRQWLPYYHQTVEPILAPHFQLSLMLHQQYAVVWMMCQERLPHFGINSLLWEERSFADGPCSKYYVSPALGQIRLEPPDTMTGGLLCDEMGLGKTIEILGLIVATLLELKEETARYNGRGKMVHSTLIVVPPALVSQWQKEIVKCTGDALIVDVVDGKNGHVVRHGNNDNMDLDADIVLTTYQALKGRTVSQMFFEKRWGRIVLDEMQEIRKATTMIAKTCEKLRGSRRWMLSGTPLFEGIKDLRGELNFLRLEPFSADSEDGFFDFMVTHPWLEHKPIAIDALKVLSSVMLRRSKSMTIKATGASILDLKPLTVEFVPVQQSNSERAIYYFLESVLARVANFSSTVQDDGLCHSDIKQAKVSQRQCLRLLRETCNSVIALNGGIGVSSQLKALNNVLIEIARKKIATTSILDDSNDSHPLSDAIMSCDEAIVHLAQIQHDIRINGEENETTGLMIGFGQGLSKRRRAHDSIDQKISDSREMLQKAKMDLQLAASQRAKAYWHLALERVTMGEVSDDLVSSVDKFRSLWKWRFLLTNLCVRQSKKFPTLLCRGWRPCPVFVQNMHRIHPEFYWSHPNAFTIADVPHNVSPHDVTNAIANALVEMGTCDCFDTAKNCFSVIVRKKIGVFLTWNAVLQFDNKDIALAMVNKAASSSGIVIENTASLPQVKGHIQVCKSNYDEAHASYLFLPTEINLANQRKASAALNLAKRGLRIVRTNQIDELSGKLRVFPANGPYRNFAPKFSQLLFESMNKMIADCTCSMSVSIATLHSEEEKIAQLLKVKEKGITEPDPAILAMSGFEILEALSSGRHEETHCCICLDFLGSNPWNGPNPSASISMIDCGHLYCRKCLQSCSTACPSCRKAFSFKSNVTHIDPARVSDPQASRIQSKAERDAFLEASRLLDHPDGVLEPKMWDMLYHAIEDHNPGVRQQLDVRVSAIPRKFLGHLRSCIQGVLVMGKPSDTPECLDIEHSCLSTKVKALLHDIPITERSVVFSNYSSTIKHLECVLNCLGVGCRSLHVGQHAACSERAVNEWQSIRYSDITTEPFIPYPVLLIQAGAAASGLTLTAAHKIFLMEPFTHHSEELQAYGRCHRHGQMHAVHVKCYYAPVSIESRLLDRRRTGAAFEPLAQTISSSKDEPVVTFSSLYCDDSGDER